MGQRDRLKGIADAIREKTGSTEKIKATDFVTEISNVYKAGEKSEYDRFWDNFQQNGTRTQYSQAFAQGGWNDETFQPKYDIIAKDAITQMFQYSGITDLKQKLEDLGIKFEMTNCSHIGQAFQGVYIKVIPPIDMTLVTGQYASQYAFGSAYTHTIEKLIVSENTHFANAFNGATSLENLTIEGVIGQGDFSVTWSTKLKKASIISIINALSTTTSGLSVTLSKTAVNNAFETSTGLADGSTSHEWLDLIATKNNWTITLA